MRVFASNAQFIFRLQIACGFWKFMTFWFIDLVVLSSERHTFIYWVHIYWIEVLNSSLFKGLWLDFVEMFTCSNLDYFDNLHWIPWNCIFFPGGFNSLDLWEGWTAHSSGTLPSRPPSLGHLSGTFVATDTTICTLVTTDTTLCTFR